MKRLTSWRILGLGALAGCQALSGLSGLEPGEGAGGGAATNSASGGAASSSTGGAPSSSNTGGGGMMNGSGGGVTGTSVGVGAGGAGGAVPAHLEPDVGTSKFFDCTGECAVTGVSTDPSSSKVAVVGYYRSQIAFGNGPMLTGAAMSRWGFLAIYDSWDEVSPALAVSFEGNDINAAGDDVVPVGVAYSGDGSLLIAGNHNNNVKITLDTTTYETTEGAGEPGGFALLIPQSGTTAMASLTGEPVVLGVAARRTTGSSDFAIYGLGSGDVSIDTTFLGSLGSSKSGWWTTFRPNTFTDGGSGTLQSSGGDAMLRGMAFIGTDIVVAGQGAGGTLTLDATGQSGGGETNKTVAGDAGLVARIQGGNVVWIATGAASGEQVGYEGIASVVQSGVPSLAISGYTTADFAHATESNSAFLGDSPAASTDVLTYIMRLDPDDGSMIDALPVSETNPAGLDFVFPYLDVAYSTQRVPVGAGTANGTVRTPSGPELTSMGHDGLWLEPLESGSFWSGLVGASGFTATLDVAPTVDPLQQGALLLGGGCSAQSGDVQLVAGPLTHQFGTAQGAYVLGMRIVGDGDGGT